MREVSSQFIINLSEILEILKIRNCTYAFYTKAYNTDSIKQIINNYVH